MKNSFIQNNLVNLYPSVFPCSARRCAHALRPTRAPAPVCAQGAAHREETLFYHYSSKGALQNRHANLV